MARLTGMVKRGGMYWLRVRVPVDLISTFKKREIVYSLRTKDRADAELKASAERLRIQLEFQSHRKGRSRPGALKNLRDLSVDEIQGLVQHWFYDLEKAATQAPAIGSVVREPLDLKEHLIELREDMATMQTELAGKNQPFDPVWTDKPLRDILSGNGVAKIESAESRDRLRRLILRGLIEAQRRMHERLGGGDAGEPDTYFSAIDADAPPPPSKDIKRVKGTTLRELLTQFLSEQGPKNLRNKTLLQYRTVITRFEEVVGMNTPITEITRQHCITFRDLLAQTPSNASKRFPGMKMQQVANLPKEKMGTILSTRSVNKTLETLSAILAYAEDCDLLRKNYARKIKLQTSGPKKNRTFSAEQLRLLFGAPIFHEYTLSREPKAKNSRFWIPLIGLFSGMRQNEICQLYVEDIKEEDGIPFFAVREELDSGSRALDKHLKTKNAWRRVPIHPTLIQLGFMKLVRIKKEAGAIRIFDELPYSAGQNYSDAFQKWFSRLLKQTGVGSTRRVTFHGLRHTFRDALRVPNVSTGIAQALGGWERDDSLSEHYGQGYPLEMLHREISKVAYEGIPPAHFPKQS